MNQITYRRLSFGCRGKRNSTHLPLQTGPAFEILVDVFYGKSSNTSFLHSLAQILEVQMTHPDVPVLDGILRWCALRIAHLDDFSAIDATLSLETVQVVLPPRSEQHSSITTPDLSLYKYDFVSSIRYLAYGYKIRSQVRDVQRILKVNYPLSVVYLDCG